MWPQDAGLASAHPVAVATHLLGFSLETLGHSKPVPVTNSSSTSSLALCRNMTEAIPTPSRQLNKPWPSPALRHTQSLPHTTGPAQKHRPGWQIKTLVLKSQLCCKGSSGPSVSGLHKDGTEMCSTLWKVNGDRVVATAAEQLFPSATLLSAFPAQCHLNSSRMHLTCTVYSRGTVFRQCLGT